jgi:hypothetical protein
MADGGGFPLWGRRGWISSDRARERLGFDEALIDDLLAWGLEPELSSIDPDLLETRVERGEALRDRIQAQVGAEFTVELIEP